MPGQMCARIELIDSAINLRVALFGAVVAASAQSKQIARACWRRVFGNVGDRQCVRNGPFVTRLRMTTAL